MSAKKFIAPNIAILLFLSLFWFAGVENIVKGDDDHQKNLKKYVQTQRRILDNYVDQVKLSSLYKNSLRGLILNLSDSTANLKGTPADTTFKNVSINDLSESTRKFEEAYLYISNTFPDENMTKRTEDALSHMFDELDPHSVYISPQMGKLQDEQFAGKFQGIGVQFNVIQDTITVITAIAGGPSDELGIQSGDRIIAIDDSSAIGFTNEDVRSTLRGPKGSKVDVTIKRPHVSEPIDFTITRDDIPLYSLGASYMLDDKTGYVKLDRFIQTTHREFMSAMSDLKAEGMERVVLDLRGNPGGYLKQAIAISEEFFPSGTQIVSTKSRHKRFTSSYFSRRDGQFKNTSVIVLVNEGSASASEIVSGAIQDHDRGYIVGQRTFGKGLVQQQYQLVDSSKIRVTISKYYTPSGRLIQKPYRKKSGKSYAYEIYRREQNAKSDIEEFISHVPDSLKYKTDGGRTVYGGGGIVPDKIVQEDTSQSAAVLNYMRRKRIGFNFVRNYLDHNGDQFRNEWENNYQRFRDEFEWKDKDVQQMYSMLKDSNMVVSNADTLSEPDFKSDTLYIPQNHFQQVEWMVRGATKARLARQVWGLKKYYPVINDVFDNMLKEAMTMWDEIAKLKNGASASVNPGKQK
ncbi:carboxyl-terminal processing protease [Fodinibius salinus]|uniref:Carboxyl-terminal processing protease n=1 Tax=Fodinibius salinus TaxID=860790 RepID=A0A5D3YLW8_9BACT|nr:S41 family peptidase [Fodinibius salinus]TYP94837.1 carboxyl-terminal processing protease [Fodinibius salinus]